MFSFIHCNQRSFQCLPRRNVNNKEHVRIARGGRYFVERIDHSVEFKTFYEKKRTTRITNPQLKRCNIPFVKIGIFAL